MKIPVIDLSKCSLCEGCIEVSPTVFKMNNAGFIEIAELEHYPENEIDEAIKYCPEDCIYWEFKR